MHTSFNYTGNKRNSLRHANESVNYHNLRSGPFTIAITRNYEKYIKENEMGFVGFGVVFFWGGAVVLYNILEGEF